MADTAPDQLDPSAVDGYEPPVEGETSKERRNRKARNRRRAERAQAEVEAEREPATSPAGRRPGPGRPSARGKREQAVMGILTGAGVAVMAFDPFDGEVIIEGAPDLARSLANLADKRPAVARALDSLTETSAWAEVAVALGGIVVPIVRHHAAARPQLDEPDAPTEQASQPARARSNSEPNTPPPQVDDTAPVFTVKLTSDEPDPVPTFRA